MTEGVTPAFADRGGSGFFGQLPTILWQRRQWIVAPLVLFALAGIAVSMLLPTTYRSTATLLVETQDLPAELVNSPVTSLIGQRIARIRQQILSRGDLIGLIQRNNLYAEERRTKPLSEIVDTMRGATSIEAIETDIGSDPNRTSTIAFALSFDYKTANEAQIVTQALVDRFLEVDSNQTVDQARSTVEFLEDQSQTLQRQIVDLEGTISAIKAQNGIALVSTGMMAAPANSGSYDAQIAALQRDNAQLSRQANTVVEDPVVARAEVELASAQAVYAESHPDIALARQRLDEARRIAAARPSSRAPSLAAAQIGANNSQIAALSQAKAGEAARSANMMNAQSRAPVVLERIAQIESRAATLREQYQTVSTNLLNARTASRMETEQLGERFTVTDPPVAPDRPVSPNRPLLIAGGLLLGALAGVALALAIELMRRPIRGVESIETMLGVGPMVVIPTLVSDGSGKKRFGFAS